MVEFGPIQMIALGFPELESLDGALLKEIFKLSDYKIIRVVGLLAIVKDDKGKIGALQLTQLSDDDRIKFSCRRRIPCWSWCRRRRGGKSRIKCCC